MKNKLLLSLLGAGLLLSACGNSTTSSKNSSSNPITPSVSSSQQTPNVSTPTPSVSTPTVNDSFFSASDEALLSKYFVRKQKKSIRILKFLCFQIFFIVKIMKEFLTKELEKD